MRSDVDNSNNHSHTRRENYVKTEAGVLGKYTSKNNNWTNPTRANKRSMSLRINDEQKRLICQLIMAINLLD